MKNPEENKMHTDETKKLIAFLEKSPDCFSAAANIAKTLENNGFTRLYESEKWDIQPGGKYFVMRNMSSITAFKIPVSVPPCIIAAAAHSDSPSFKIKPSPEMESEGYVRLNTEGYGGMIDSSWLDRPLSVSGRISVKAENGIETKAVNINRDLVLIPNLCIHMNRNINKGYEYNHQRDLIPLFGSEKGFMRIVAEIAGVDEDKICGHDLFLYNRTPGTIWGGNNEYFSCGRIDDLQCAYALCEGFLRAGMTDALQIIAVFDNEETGSSTRQGAKSDFLRGTLERIFSLFPKDSYRRAIANGFMVSADNGHAVHPNHSDKSDPANRVYMNKGIVIKYNAEGSYTTDSISEAIMKLICEKADVPYQTFTNRSDMRGGSTLGNLSGNQVSINTVDIGLAQLAMHSAYETAGTMDTEYLIRAMTELFNTVIEIKEDKLINFRRC